MMPNERPNLISTRMLHRQIARLNGSRASAAGPNVITAEPRSLHLESLGDVALIVGGGGDPLSEYEAARQMVEVAGKTWETFVCNSAIPFFPDKIDNACTLHPDQMNAWTYARNAKGLPMPYGRTWAHRPYNGFSNYTKDWQGSSGLFMVKVARECTHTHIILCGVPMTVEDKHFVRHQEWNAAHGFRRGWNRHLDQLRPFVRSMSGWTKKELGAPTFTWINDEIPDPNPLHWQPLGLKA